jgi:hypothetical protein
MDLEDLCELAEQTEYVVKYGQYEGMTPSDALKERHTILMDAVNREIDLDLDAAQAEWDALSPEQQEYELGKDDPESDHYDPFHDCFSDEDVMDRINQPGGPWASPDDIYG